MLQFDFSLLCLLQCLNVQNYSCGIKFMLEDFSTKAIWATFLAIITIKHYVTGHVLGYKRNNRSFNFLPFWNVWFVP